MNADELKSSPILQRHPTNPVLSPDDVPYRTMLAFNAGIEKYQGRYVMIFRNDFGDRATGRVEGTNLGLAFSDDGISWQVDPKPINQDPEHPLAGTSDPRLTVLDGRLYLTFSRGKRGTCGGVAVTDDLENWDVLSVSVPDNRNMVIFPERLDGKIVRLERPFAGYLRPGDRFDTWLSASPDGRYWGDSELVITCDEFEWCNDKIGPGAPPVKTPRGWLTTLHIVDIDPSRKWGWSGVWAKQYVIGLMLLDLEEPHKVIGLCREPVLVPEEAYAYEMEGYRDHVLFPGGMILEDDGEVKIYYGAADTVECLATAHVDDLLALCEPV